MSDEIEILQVHFEVPYHYLPIREFYNYSLDVERIAKDISSKVFHNVVNLEIVVFAPEKGSLRGKYGFKITALSAASLGAFFMGMDTDIPKRFFYGLTGHEPSYYAEVAGSDIRKGSLAIVDMTRGFLSKNINEIQVKPNEIPRAYIAKNDFYGRCLRNQEMSGVGFDCDDHSHVGRDDFSSKIAILSKKDLGLDPEYGIHKLKVVASVNTLISEAQWKFQDVQTRRSIRAYMKDKAFMERFLGGNHPLKLHQEDDVVVALVEYVWDFVNGEMKIVRRNILKVYEFNDSVFEELPKGSIIAAVDGIQSGASAGQASLLDGISQA